MKHVDEKIKSLLEERETLITEMHEIQKAFNARQERLIEINGSLKTLQEIINVNNVEENINDK